MSHDVSLVMYILPLYPCVAVNFTARETISSLSYILSEHVITVMN